MREAVHHGDHETTLRAAFAPAVPPGRDLESAGFGKRTARLFRVLLDDAGLRCPSAHLDFLNGEPAELFANATAIGAGYATSSILVPGTGAPSYRGVTPGGYTWQFRAMTLADARKAAARANELGRLAQRAGLRYAYHNHFFEFVTDAGVAAYDILLRETDPAYVWIEIDCGWMRAAGHDASGLLRGLRTIAAQFEFSTEDILPQL